MCDSCIYSSDHCIIALKPLLSAFDVGNIVTALHMHLSVYHCNMDSRAALKPKVCSASYDHKLQGQQTHQQLVQECSLHDFYRTNSMPTNLDSQVLQQHRAYIQQA